MKPEQLLEAFSYVDDDLLEKSESGNAASDAADPAEAAESGTNIISFRSKATHWRRWGALAACACLVLIIFSIRPLLLGKSSASMSTASESYDSAAAAESAEEAANDSVSVDAFSEQSLEDNAAEEKLEALWVTCGGTEYTGLTADHIADYGIPEEVLENVPDSDIGDLIGTVEDASDQSLTGAEIYESKAYPGLVIIKTEDGAMYFCKA